MFIFSCYKHRQHQDPDTTLPTVPKGKYMFQCVTSSTSILCFMYIRITNI